MSIRRPMRRPAVWVPLLQRFTDGRRADRMETRRLFESVTAAFRASVWARPEAVELVSERIAEEVGRAVPVPADQRVCAALDRCLHRLLQMEEKIFRAPKVSGARQLTLAEESALRKALREQAAFLADEQYVTAVLEDTLGALMQALIKALPPIADSPFTVPLIELAGDPAAVAESVLAHVCAPDVVDVGLLTSVRARVIENVRVYSRIPQDGNSNKEPVLPRDAGLSGQELAQTYFGGTPICDLLLTAVPFSLPEEQRYAGHWIIAPPGRGKTTLLSAMIWDDLKRDASIIIMDSKGDLIAPIKELAAIKDRLVVIEPDLEFPLALNPLDMPKTNVAHTVSLLEYVFSALLEAKMTALQMTLFRKVLPAIIAGIPNATLETFVDVIANGVERYKACIEALPPEQRNFFFDTQSGFLSKTYTETRNQLIWRLQFLLSNPIIRQMFSAVKTKLDIGKEMDAGKVIVIDNSKKQLGDEGAEFFGRFFIALILAAAEQRSGRPQSGKKSCYFYIDECQSVIRRDEKISTILDECRSQKIAVILAHQRTAQIISENVLDALANCAIRMANSDDEAKYLADKLRSTADDLRSLPRGTFATFVRDQTRGAIALQVPQTNLADLPRLTSVELRDIKERMRREYAAAPAASADPTVKRPAEQPPAETGEEQEPSEMAPASRGAAEGSETGATW